MADQPERDGTQLGTTRPENAERHGGQRPNDTAPTDGGCGSPQRKRARLGEEREPPPAEIPADNGTSAVEIAETIDAETGTAHWERQRSAWKVGHKPYNPAPSDLGDAARDHSNSIPMLAVISGSSQGSGGGRPLRLVIAHLVEVGSERRFEDDAPPTNDPQSWRKEGLYDALRQ